MRVGVFGGSFDPVHRGHVRVAESALRRCALDLLKVIPAKVSPFKVSNSPCASDQDRLEMLRLAFAGIDRTEICDHELVAGGVSYAIDTVRWVRENYPGAEVVFVIGEDSVAGLPRWREYDELVKLCSFEVFPRTKESSTEVRNRLSKGEPIDDLVIPTVARYIMRNNCYHIAKLKEVIK